MKLPIPSYKLSLSLQLHLVQLISERKRSEVIERYRIVLLGMELNDLARGEKAKGGIWWESLSILHVHVMRRGRKRNTTFPTNNDNNNCVHSFRPPYKGAQELCWRSASTVDTLINLFKPLERKMFYKGEGIESSPHLEWTNSSDQINPYPTRSSILSPIITHIVFL